MHDRSELLARLRAGQIPDTVIIGGGINAVGTFRDLCAQQVPTLLVEQGDFSSGTSAAPSRLIHGGLRYLETGEAGLVRESLTERNLLLGNARHLVHPQPIWVPLFNWFAGSIGAVARFFRLTRTPGAKGAIPVKLGLMLYDVFGRAYQTMPDHRFIRAPQARREVPVLTRDVVAIGEYYDARITHPERLVMELVADAEADCPESMAIPYLAAGKWDGEALELIDRIDGGVYRVKPKLLINATGAWVDRVQSELGFKDKLIGGTRGSHLVMRSARLFDALDGKMLYFETEDHRACLIYPMEDDLLLLGTTDIRSDNPDDMFCTDEEIDYLFKVLAKVVPNHGLTYSDIVFAFAGVRPLPKMTVNATGAISRDHRIDEFEATPDRPFPILALIGGKWTTYRAFAEQVTDRALQRLGKSRLKSTDTLPIGGAADFPVDKADLTAWIRQLAEQTGISVTRCTQLTSRYGSRAREITAAECNDARNFPSQSAYSPAEIEYICAHERVTSLADILLRRTLMSFEGLVNSATMREVGEIAAQTLGWDTSRLEREISEATSLLEQRHRVDLSHTNQ